MRVSFICASFNYKDYISEAIESVISQDCPDWELIVFDDGSKDGSQELIANYAKNDKRIKFLTHPNNVNRGLIETLKAASQAASGDWLAFIESDDILRPDYLSSKIKAFNDYNDIFNDTVDYYARFSKDFIKDPDAVEDKVYYYFTMIPKEK